MSDRRVDLGFRDFFLDGKARIVEYARSAIREKLPQESKLLQPEEEMSACLEPFLHLCLSEPSGFQIGQFVYGYIGDTAKPPSFPVRSDEGGVVYLPNIGFFRTELPNSDLTLHFDRSDRSYEIRKDEARVDRGFEGIQPLEGAPSLELYPRKHPCFRTFFEARGEYENTDVEAPARDLRTTLASSLRLIKEVDPLVYADSLDISRKVILLANERIYSFASINAVGAIFLSTNDESDEVSLAEDVIHQAAHNTFYAVLAEPRDFFTISRHTKVSEFTVLEHDHRPLFEAFHGIYTLGRIVQFFDACLEQKRLTGRLEHHLNGRFALAMQRYTLGLEAIGDERLYKEKGRVVLTGLRDCRDEVWRRREALLGPLDVSNQPYVFSYSRFCDLNPNGGAGGPDQ